MKPCLSNDHSMVAHLILSNQFLDLISLPHAIAERDGGSKKEREYRPLPLIKFRRGSNAFTLEVVLSMLL